MLYPAHLSPHKNFKYIQVSTKLNNQFLIRHTESRNLFFEGTDIFNFELVKIQSGDLNDFSTSLLGIFKYDDVFIGWLKERKDIWTKLWREGDEVEIPIYKKDFIIFNQRGFFLLNIEDLKIAEIKHESDKIGIINLRFKVLHTPTISNFWHFSIRVIDDKKEEVNKMNISNNLRRKILRTAKIILGNNAKVKKPDITIIPESLYK